MKKLLLLITFTLTLFAQNPLSFGALGDVIYDDIDKFELLKEMPVMREYKGEIEEYIEAAEKSKKMGFAVDEKSPDADAKVYLKVLRDLSVKHDAIIVQSRARFKEAIDDEDSETINLMIYYGIIDPQEYEKAMIAYYGEFGEDHNLSTLTPMYTAYLNSLKKDDNGTQLTDEQREAIENEERIKRIRARIKAKEEALQKSVEEEQESEKKKVLNEQKKELGL